MYKTDNNPKNFDFFVLALDTTSFNASVSVLKNFSPVVEIDDMSETTHSKRILKLIDRSIDIAGIKLSDISGIAVSTGPGSFTGVRIGMASAKGIAYALRLNIVGIMSLEALAAGAPFTDMLICPVIDAQRKEVYFSGYKYEDNILNCKIKARACAIEALPEYIKEPALFIGDGLVKYRRPITSMLKESANFISDDFNTVKASCVGRLAEKFFLNNKERKLYDIKPAYIRNPDIRTNNITTFP